MKGEESESIDEAKKKKEKEDKKEDEDKKIMAMDDKAAALEAAKNLIMQFRKEQLDKGQTPNAVRADVSDLRQKLGLSGLGGSSDSVISINRENEKRT
jgi:beta-phosphoglucomutase-like phosphatase (HAD superfamily)